MAGRVTKERRMSAEALARGQRLREARMGAGLTVDDVATALGVKPMAVYRWEWGVSSFRMDDAVRVAGAYRVRVGWLVAGERPARVRRSARRSA